MTGAEFKEICMKELGDYCDKDTKGQGEKKALDDPYMVWQQNTSDKEKRMSVELLNNGNYYDFFYNGDEFYMEVYPHTEVKPEHIDIIVKGEEKT